MTNDNIVLLKDNIWNYIKICTREPLCIFANIIFLDIKNKLATTIACLFRKSYLTIWPQFFEDFISLIQPCLADLSVDANTYQCDLFLSLLKSIDEEIVNITLVKSKQDLNLNTKIVLN